MFRIRTYLIMLLVSLVVNLNSVDVRAQEGSGDDAPQVTEIKPIPEEAPKIIYITSLLLLLP